jgi:hypothetical protein
LINPVDGELALGGHESEHTAANVTTSWRYLLLEFESAESFDWLAALVQMPLPIAAIYTGGGRSIHTLLRVDAKSKRQWDAVASDLKPALVVLGANPKAFSSAVQLSRLPCCECSGTTGGPRLLYLNSAPDPIAICNKKEFTK